MMPKEPKYQQLLTSSTDQKDLLSKSFETAELRRSQFIKAMPPELSNKEDRIQHKLLLDNASSRSKLRKIYNLMTELGHAAEPYVACGNGCSSCCNMNVTISQIEANLIAEKIGIKSKQLARSLTHESGEFMGTPCVFLKDGSCSVYEVRPFACRKHVSFDTSSYWCDPSVASEAELPMVEYSGALGAFLYVTEKKTGGIFGDIRDFFVT